MSIRSTGIARLSRAKRFAAAATLAVVGLGSLTGAASANFTLNSGTIEITDGDPFDAAVGSWVALPTDNTRATPNYFQNPSSSSRLTPTGFYSLIRNGIARGGTAPGLTLGAVQTGGNLIVGDTTDDFNGFDWYLYSRAATPTSAPGWTPTLEFAGSASSTGRRALVSGGLEGLWVAYAGNDYYVGTGTSAATGRNAPLTGWIEGAVGSNPVITLQWNTDLASPYAPGFEAFNASFQLQGVHS